MDAVLLLLDQVFLAVRPQVEPGTYYAHQVDVFACDKII
jgi:hypothetical protein